LYRFASPSCGNGEAICAIGTPSRSRNAFSYSKRFIRRCVARPSPANRRRSDATNLSAKPPANASRADPSGCFTSSGGISPAATLS
jgi:hypothetical protein